MKGLWILSRSTTLYSTRRLAESAAALSLDVRVVDPLRTAAAWAPRPTLLLDGETLQSAPTHVIPRIGAASARASLGVLRHLELMGSVPLNSSSSIIRARDKLATAQALISAGIPVPPSVVVRGPSQLRDALNLVDGPPVVMKVLKGSRGVGVVLLETESDVVMHAQLLWQAGEEVLLQRYVRESKGTDMRAIVVGNRVVAAMERRARRGEFRANVHQGGSVHPTRLSTELWELAVRACKAVGLGAGGVDIIAGHEGPLVLEVNASPGLRGIEKATGVDVAAQIVGDLVHGDDGEHARVKKRKPQNA